MDARFDQFVTKKKPMYPPGERLRQYLAKHGRAFTLPVSYSRLTEWQESMPLYDKEGNDTLWRTLIYRPEVMRRLNKHLTAIYALLKTEGDSSFVDHLYVDRIDYCTFGNSNPFRIRVVNAYNDNQDYYYIKKLDASRIYGLEFEHLLSPNRMHYLVANDILVEEHIVGIPGDIFIEQWLETANLNKIRLAKELIKFNERCFVRLLGDMRAYNWVVEMTPDFENVQIRLRPMDFDQQSYSGRLNFYRPQFFKDNNALVSFVTDRINIPTARQYQREEQSVIYRRIELVRDKINSLLDCMRENDLSTPEKVVDLRTSLAEHYHNKAFLACENMGELLDQSLIQIRDNLKGMRAKGSAMFDS